MGEHRWLTVTLPDGIAGVEVVLEPMAFAPARVYQKALYEAGIPATAFMTDDIAAEVERLEGQRRRVPRRAPAHGADHHGDLRGHLRQSDQSRAAAGASAVVRTIRVM